MKRVARIIIIVVGTEIARERERSARMKCPWKIRNNPRHRKRIESMMIAFVMNDVGVKVGFGVEVGVP